MEDRLMKLLARLLQRADTLFARDTVQAIQRLLLAAMPYRVQIIGAFVGMVVVAATEPALVWLVKYLVDHGTHAVGTWQDKVLLAGAMVIVFAIRGTAGFMAGYLMIRVSSDMLADMQANVYYALLNADMRLDDMELGRAVNSVVAEGRNALELVERVLIKFFRSLFSVVALAFTLLTIHPIAFPLMSFVVPFVWIVRMRGRSYEGAANEYVSANSRLARCIEEVLQQVDLVRQYQAFEFEGRRLDSVSKKVNNAYRRMLSLAGQMVPITQTIMALYLAIIFWIKPWLGHAITPGEFAALSATLLLMMVPLRDLAEVNGALLRSVVAVLTVFAAVDVPSERLGALIAGFKGTPTVGFENVSLHYPARSLPLLECINFSVTPGEIVAIVGPNGSGKTSILNLVAGLTSAGGGTVRIGGTCIDHLDIDDLRKRIAYVTQEPLLLDGSIEFNVCYGESNPDHKRLWAALESAQMASFVAALPAREHAVIGHGGLQLSGGQRQLLAIARAIYRDVSLVLLDEPTSSLDVASEQALVRSLATLVKGKTTLMVTHSRSLLYLADRVLRLEAGRLYPHVNHEVHVDFAAEVHA